MYLWSRKNWRNFLKDSLTLQVGAFFCSVAYICTESDRMFLKILSHMHPWRSKSLLNFGGNPESGSRLQIQTKLFSVEVCGLQLLLFSMLCSSLQSKLSWFLSNTFLL